jgi:hypothetical protein
MGRPHLVLREVLMKLEPVPSGTVCVWCWQGIDTDQASLKLKEGAHAHLACDSRMMNFIKSLEEHIK